MSTTISSSNRRCSAGAGAERGRSGPAHISFGGSGCPVQSARALRPDTAVGAEERASMLGDPRSHCLWEKTAPAEPPAPALTFDHTARSEERRVGKACANPCRSRVSQYQLQKQKHKKTNL